MTGRACAPRREDCYIAAHDAKTGKEVWRFYTAAASNEPGGETWGGAPDETRAASTWGLPGGYDPVRRLIYWGVANPTPNTRANRHGGNSNAIPTESPADLYSNSTIALDPDTGKLALVLPAPARRRLGRGLHERAHAAAHGVQSRSEVREVDQPRRQARRAARRRGDGGRGRRHLRATTAAPASSSGRHPFPFDTPDFLISNIDGKTGPRVAEQEQAVHRAVRSPGHLLLEHAQLLADGVSSRRQRAVRAVCRELPRHDDAPGPNGKPRERRGGIPRPGSDPEHVGRPDEDQHVDGRDEADPRGRAPSNGAVLTTAGDVVFWGDLDQKFRAFDAESGKMLWEQTLGGPVQNSTITYAVNGKQYIAVLTGSGALIGRADGSGGDQAESRLQRALRVRAAVASRAIRVQKQDDRTASVSVIDEFDRRAFLLRARRRYRLAQRCRAAQAGDRAAAPDPLIEDLVAGNRILAMEGVLDAMGHVSVRHPSRPDRFLLARSMAPELVTAADILEYDLDGNAGRRARPHVVSRALHPQRDLSGPAGRAAPSCTATRRR